MRPGARPARLDAVRSSLCLCLIVILHRVEAAGYEGGVYNGEWDQFLWAMAEMVFLYISELLGQVCNAWECVSM